LAIRGTEPSEVKTDVFDDTNVNGIGYEQFNRNKQSLINGLKEVSEPYTGIINPITPIPTIVGHSLGGAIAQNLAVAYSDQGGQLAEVVTFNSPGIVNSKTISAKVTHYITSGDLVSMAGTTYIPGSVVLSSYTSTSIQPKAVADKHSVPIIANYEQRNKLSKPNGLQQKNINSSYLSNPQFRYLDKDYFNLQIIVAILGDLIGKVIEPRLPYLGSYLAAALTYRKTVEEHRKEIGAIWYGLQNQSQQDAITTITNKLRNNLNNFDPEVWEKLTQQTLRLLEKSDFTVGVNLTPTNLSNLDATQILSSAQKQVESVLRDFAKIPNQELNNKLTVAFGEDINTDKAKTLQQEWAIGNFQNLPSFEITPASNIYGANGAYSIADNKIYLSQELLNSQSLASIVDVYLEEIGHYVDSQINEIDAPGDEGKLFSSVVQNKQITDAWIQAVKEEDDMGYSLVDSNPNLAQNFWEAVAKWPVEAWDTIAKWTPDTWQALTRWSAENWDVSTKWTIDDWMNNPFLIVSNPEIIEGDSGSNNLAFTVSLSTASSKNVTVTYKTQDTTALADEDYQAVEGTLEFLAGETNKTVFIPIFGDVSQENNETFSVKVSNASNALIVNDQGVGKIIDNDYVSNSNNHAPTLNYLLNNQVVQANSLFTLTLPQNTFSDIDTIDPLPDTLTYSATLKNGTKLPDWLKLDPATGNLSGTPLSEDVGTLDINIKAKDKLGAIASDVFQLRVDVPSKHNYQVSLVKDIAEIGNSNPSSLTDFNHTLFFLGFDNHDDGLWKTDGTTNGTILVSYIKNSNLQGLTKVNDTLFFVDSGGHRLWKSDGTAAGTTLVKDIYLNIENPSSLTNINGTLFFNADDGIHGEELWKSDGTAAGTTLVKDIYLGDKSSFPSAITILNNSLFFMVTGATDYELWKSNGTEAGTILIKSFNFINYYNRSTPNGGLTNLNGTLFFSPGNFGDLWKSDGTTTGTVLVQSSGYPYNIQNIININNTLFFKGQGKNYSDYGLWKSDGTEVGTVFLKTLTTISNLTNINGTLFFRSGGDGYHGAGLERAGVDGSELWKSDGTVAGTVLVKDINLGVNSSDPGGFTEVNGTIFFSADDGTHGRELWKTDGTATGTVLVEDINLGVNGSGAGGFTEVNGKFFFIANDGIHGGELWQWSKANITPIVDAYKTISLLIDASNAALNISAPTDADNDPFAITVTAIPDVSKGTILLGNGSIVANGSILTPEQLASLTFVPVSHTVGSVGVFKYSVSDDQGGIVSQTINLEIVGVNDAPVVQANKILSISEDTASVPLNIIAPTDLNGDVLTITVNTLPNLSKGKVQLSNGTDLATNQTLTTSQLTELVFVPVADGDAGTFSYTVSDGKGGIASQTITLDITPSNIPVNSVFIIASASAIEGGLVNFTVTRTGDTQATQAVTVTTSIAITDTTSATDFTANTQTLSFAQGETTKTFSVQTTQDNLFEDNETFTTTLSAATGSATISGVNGTATGTINNDQVPPVFAISSASATEGSAIAFTVTRTGDAQAAQAVTVDTSIGVTDTASFTDFTANSQTLSFAQGETTKTFSVQTTQDVLPEADETFTVLLTTPTNGTSSATGTIIDDDIPKISLAIAPATVLENGITNLVYTFTRTGITTSTLSVNYNVSGTTTFGNDYSQNGASIFSASTGTVIFAVNSATATVTIDPSADIIFESDETITLTLVNGSGYNIDTTTPVTGTIANDESVPIFAFASANATEGGPTVFTITRTGDAQATQSVTVTASIGATDNVISASDFTAKTETLSFAQGEITKTFSVQTTQDTLFESNETFTATLSAATNGAIISATNGKATGTINNDDPAPIFAIASVSTTEGGLLNFTVTRTGDAQATQSVTVSTAIATTDTTSTNDFTAKSETLSFAQGETTKTFSVQSTQDSVFEGNETFTSSLSAATNGATISSTIGLATGTINNDDPIPKATLSRGNDDVFRLDGSNTAKLKVSFTNADANSVNEIGYFTVDDATGKIGSFAIGSAGYAQAALERSKVIFSTIANKPSGYDPSNTSLIEAAGNLRFYLIKTGTTTEEALRSSNSSNILFSTSSAKITDLGSGSFAIAWDDGSGNNDFKSLAIKVEGSDEPLAIGTKQQGNSFNGKGGGEVIDLLFASGLAADTKSVNADFIVNREAAFNNFVGFYKVTDTNGGIDINGDGVVDFTPGQSGYITAAVQNRVAGIDLAVSNQGSASMTGKTFEVNSIFAPFIIVNGNTSSFADNNTSNDPAVYFSYLGANTDGVDHIRLLGSNTFGFEDLAGGGDRDFNDIIIKATLTAVK